MSNIISITAGTLSDRTEESVRETRQAVNLDHVVRIDRDEWACNKNLPCKEWDYMDVYCIHTVTGDKVYTVDPQIELMVDPYLTCSLCNAEYSKQEMCCPKCKGKKKRELMPLKHTLNRHPMEGGPDADDEEFAIGRIENPLYPGASLAEIERLATEAREGDEIFTTEIRVKCDCCGEDIEEGELVYPVHGKPKIAGCSEGCRESLELFYHKGEICTTCHKIIPIGLKSCPSCSQLPTGDK
jgi:hypothetical protein